MHTLLFIHLVAMAFWLGGQLFLAIVAVPALRGHEEDQRRALFQSIGKWYGMLSIPALILLIITGGMMMSKLHLDTGSSTALQHKMEALSVVLVGTVVHTIAGAKRKRRLARVASMTTLIATLVVVWFAIGI